MNADREATWNCRTFWEGDSKTERPLHTGCVINIYENVKCSHSFFFTLDKGKQFKCSLDRMGKNGLIFFLFFSLYFSNQRRRRRFGYTPSYKITDRRGRVSPLHRRLETVPQPVLTHFRMLVGQTEALLQMLPNIFWEEVIVDISNVCTTTLIGWCICYQCERSERSTLIPKNRGYSCRHGESVAQKIIIFNADYLHERKTKHIKRVKAFIINAHSKLSAR